MLFTCSFAHQRYITRVYIINDDTPVEFATGHGDDGQVRLVKSAPRSRVSVPLWPYRCSIFPILVLSEYVCQQKHHR